MNKLKEIICNSRRKRILRNILDFSGKIGIEDDRVVGLVSKLSLNYTYKRGDAYGMCLCGYDSKKLSLEDREYFSNRPIYYVFENITFDKGITVETFFDANVIFRNCTFNDYVRLDGVSNVVFENNKYMSSNSEDKIFFRGYGNKIKFIDDNFVNSKEDSEKINMNINFENVEIVNSNVEVKDGDVSIKTKELLLDNTIIECSSMNLECANVIYQNSSVIDAKKRIVVNNKNNTFDFGSADAPVMINNGSLVKEKEKVSEEVVNARGVLISQLRSIRDMFANINSVIMDNAYDKINNRAIGKIRIR